MVGVNDFITGDEEPLEILHISRHLEQEQVERVREVRWKRDQTRCTKAVEPLWKVTQSPSVNLMPYILVGARDYATEGEIMGAMVDVFAPYTKKAII